MQEGDSQDGVSDRTLLLEKHGFTVVVSNTGEAALARLEEALVQLELGNETAGLGIWQLHLQSGELDWNEQMCAIYGVEFRIQRRGGEIRHVYASARPIHDRGGAVSQIIGINMDVTESRQTERALQEREAHFRLLAENSADPIALFDANFNLVYVTPAAAEIFGYVQEDFSERSVFEILHEEDRTPFQDRVAEPLRGHTPRPAACAARSSAHTTSTQKPAPFKAPSSTSATSPMAVSWRADPGDVLGTGVAGWAHSRAVSRKRTQMCHVLMK